MRALPSRTAFPAFVHRLVTPAKPKPINSHIPLSPLYQQRYNNAPFPAFYKQEIFEEMFEDLDEKIQDWYKLIKCDPNYVLHYHDGEKVELSTDMTKMKIEIEKWEGKDGWSRFLDFMNESHIHYEVSVKEVLHRNFPNIQSLLSLPYLL